MPLYEYQCESCGRRFEKIQKFSDPLVETCPTCGGRVHKLVSSPAFHLKGTGWYATDYSSKDKGQSADTDKGDPASSAAGAADSASKASKDPKDSKDTKDSKDSKASKDSQDTKTSSDSSGAKETAPTSSKESTSSTGPSKS
jgi:putative FmdB family regulatory protein